MSQKLNEDPEHRRRTPAADEANGSEPSGEDPAQKDPPRKDPLQKDPSDNDPPVKEPPSKDSPKEVGGRDGPDPTRYGDWEKNGRCIDF